LDVSFFLDVYMMGVFYACFVYIRMMSSGPGHQCQEPLF